MPSPGPCSDCDLYSWHGRWPPWTFLVSGCLDLVCQAKQHGILLPISVQLGRHSRACGVVCTSLVCLSGWAWELVLGRFGGFWPSSTLCAGPSFSKHFGGKGLGGCHSQGCHGYVVVQFYLRFNFFLNQYKISEPVQNF